LESINFTPRLSNSPNLAFLHSALAQIGEEIDREAQTPVGNAYSPFGTMEGFRASDPSAEMVKSLRLAPNRAGILRIGQQRISGLSDLPKLTVSAGRSGAQPRKVEPVTFIVTPREIAITEKAEGNVAVIDFDKLQNVRVDNQGRFFFLVAGEVGAPPCLLVTPWIVPALALLMADAARKGAMKELEAEIEHKVRSL
jgi:hypothetical protein